MSETAKSLATEVLSALKEPLQDVANHKAESAITGTALTNLTLNPFSLDPSSIAIWLSVVWVIVKIARDGYSLYASIKDRRSNKEKKDK